MYKQYFEQAFPFKNTSDKFTSKNSYFVHETDFQPRTRFHKQA